MRRALASGAALKAVLGPDETELRQQADAMDRDDPRLAWLLAQAARWRRANEKTLVFVAHRETLEMLREALSARAQLATRRVPRGALDGAARHRSRAVPRRRRAEPPRLDRSGRRRAQLRVLPSARALRPAVEAGDGRAAHRPPRSHRPPHAGRVVYFRPASGIGADVVRLFERLGLFREPMAGLEPQLAHIERALEEIALDPDAYAVRRARRPAHRRGAGRAHRGSTRRRISSCIASRIAPSSGHRSSRASRPTSTR